jgi:hypothetical protein
MRANAGTTSTRKEKDMFPGAGARIYRNEEGELLGWDYPSYDDPYEDVWFDDLDDWFEDEEEGWDE